LLLQYGWTFAHVHELIPDGILDEGVGSVIRHVRSRRKSLVPLPTYAAVNTASVAEVTDSRVAGFTSRMMGTRLSSLVSSLESHGVPLQLNQRDVSMAQRGPLLVSTLQEVARERRKSIQLIPNIVYEIRLEV
jgi:hypothetical protein